MSLVLTFSLMNVFLMSLGTLYLKRMLSPMLKRGTGKFSEIEGTLGKRDAPGLSVHPSLQLPVCLPPSHPFFSCSPWSLSSPTSVYCSLCPGPVCCPLHFFSYLLYPVTFVYSLFLFFLAMGLLISSNSLISFVV